MRMDTTARPHPQQRQRGATAIEFALVFSLLFGVIWGTISYALPFFLNQVMNHAVAEAVRFAVRADPDQETALYEAKLLSLAEEQITRELSFLSNTFRARLVTTVDLQEANDRRYLVVELTYPNYGAQPIVPVIRLPGLGPIPNLPGDLRASSRLRLPEN